MKAIILTAGRGSRLRPLTDTKPKALIKVNKKPILIWQINMLGKLGFKMKDIILIVGYMEGMLRTYCMHMESKGMTIITQFRPNGTANAINLAKEHIDDDFIVLSGDIIYKQEDIQKLMDYRNSVLYTDKEERLEEYGTMDMIQDRVMSINEKSTEPISNLVNCGAYHFTYHVFEYIPRTFY